MSSPEARIVKPLVPELAALPATETVPISRSWELTACARRVVVKLEKKKTRPTRTKSTVFIRFPRYREMGPQPPLSRPETLFRNTAKATGEGTPLAKKSE